ncbi:hypothetical protein AQUCO_01100561v1 [Aquilegia coerulea]|uniref:F-box domain-containing protein n=1 Tax=Aquilegia coerulea TaxID=218851 RepID=A0A2G5E7M6_AQUCA|nr:hypothetical protein AQUCO_01100561v1 [Aquilegia coerulea]
MSQLPLDLLYQIMNRLTISDLTKFRCVCTSWRSAYASAPAPDHKDLLPWLIVPLEKGIGNVWKSYLGFFSILDGKVYMLDIPEMEDRRICGSSNGWLVTVHENSDVQLLHPCSREIIDLPPLLDFWAVLGIDFSLESNLEYIIDNLSVDHREPEGHKESSDVVRDTFITKAIVSYHFIRDKVSLVVMVIARPYFTLFCYRPDMDKKWVEVSSVGKDICDVTYYNGKFYAVNFSGNVVVVENLDSPDPYAETVIYDEDHCNRPSYLTESSGDLLRVIRIVEPLHPTKTFRLVKPLQPTKTLRFVVMKLDFEQKKWLEVKSLGDHSIFLGFSNSASISTSEFPGCKGHCIYYTHDYKGLVINPCDQGIYDLESGKIDKLYADDSQENLPLSGMHQS